MNMGYGRRVIGTIGSSIEVSADGRPEAKTGGVTIDWPTIVAVSGADVALDDGITVPIGEKYLRYGQVVCLVTGGEITTLTITAGSGNVTVTVNGQTATVAFDATAGTIDTALEALSTVGVGGVAVTGTTPNYTLTWASSLGDVAVSATGATVATTSVGGRTNLYGPYDPAAVDGRQTLTRGQCFILNRTALHIEPLDDYPEAIEGGKVWLARILQSGLATHTLAAGPTKAELLAAFPRLQLVE